MYESWVNILGCTVINHVSKFTHQTQVFPTDFYAHNTYSIKGFHSVGEQLNNVTVK